MLIDIPKLIRHYNALIKSKKYNDIPEDKLRELYKAFIKQHIDLHETDNYIINTNLITTFLKENVNQLPLVPVKIKYSSVPKALSHIKLFPSNIQKTKIGNYSVIKSIGEGQYAKVYLVSDAQHHLYALKQQPIRKSTTTAIKIRNELNILKQLSKHTTPQLVPRFQEAFIQNGNINIVQEYANCGTLYEYTKTHNLTSQMKKDIQNLISELHKLHIFHKDLHTENILVQCDPETKKPTFLLSDFGESKTYKDIEQANYLFIQDLQNSNLSIDERIEKMPLESMLHDLIIHEILISKTTPSLIPIRYK